MKCPNNHEMTEIKIGEVKINRCPDDGGLWFGEDELRKAKDSEAELAKWFDFDIWKKMEEFKPSEIKRLCPVCQIPFYEIGYGSSGIKIDACKKCHGIWLDKDEFRKIIDYVKGNSAADLLDNYLKTLIQEGKEIFVGPENLKSEIGDLLAVIKLLKFKMVFGKPGLTQFWMHFPFTK